MNRQQLYQRAMSIVASRRQRAVTQAEADSRALRARLPQLEQLEREKTLAGLHGAQLSATGAPPEAVEAAFAEMRRLTQAYNALLAQQGSEADVLAPHFTCAVCRDTGVDDGSVCGCVHALMREMRQKEMDKTSPLALCSFESFSLDKYPDRVEPDLGISVRTHMTQIFDYCRAYAAHFTEHSESLYLYGYAGLGKTHLALSIAREVLAAGYDVVYLSAQDAFDQVEKQRFGEDGQTMEALLTAQLLILDDLGTEYISPYVSACLYSVINTRSNKRMPTIYTSNIVSDADLRRRYTEKIASRLLGSCEVLSFCGDDIRLQDK